MLMPMHVLCGGHAQLLMNIPFTALYFASYETAKKGLMRNFAAADAEESLLIQVHPSLAAPLLL